MMRIRAGFLKGRVLKKPRGKGVRPTADKVKAAFFNIIGERLGNACFLDLFSGTGNVGLEALSRGAQCAVFVENNPLALQTLRGNIKLTATEKCVEVLTADILQSLKFLGKKNRSFEIVYLDPPFNYRGTTKVFEALSRESLVKEGGIVALERGTHEGGELGKTPFCPWKTKKYGSVSLLFFINERAVT